MPSPRPRALQPDSPSEHSPTVPQNPHEFEPPLPTVAAGQIPSIGLIIDDFGASRQYVDSWLALPSEIAIAVIPQLADSRKVAEAASARGFDVFLHQPMQPHAFPKENPGKYGIYLWQSREEIAAVFRENLSSLGVPIAGVNNHMGSMATEDTRVMSDFFDAFPREMIFLDSRTSVKSIAYEMALSKGIGALHNNVFLDASYDSASIQSAFSLLIKIAKRRGFAIGLGHVHSIETLKCLEERLPLLPQENIRLVRISHLVSSSGRRPKT